MDDAGREMPSAGGRGGRGSIKSEQRADSALHRRAPGGLMSLRYLFGPVSADFAAQNLAGPRQQGACLAFDTEAGADLTVRPGDSWEQVRQQFPAGWQPDFLVLHLPYTTVPACLWSAPLPRVA